MQLRLSPGMVERHQRPPLPVDDPPGILPERQPVRFDPAKRVQGNPPQRHDQPRLHQLDRLREMGLASPGLRRQGPPVPPARIEWQTQHRVRDEHLVASQPGLRQQRLETPPGFISLERNARPPRPQPSRSLADEQQVRRQRAASRSQHRAPGAHSRACPARLRPFEQLHALSLPHRSGSKASGSVCFRPCVTGALSGCLPSGQWASSSFARP